MLDITTLFYKKSQIWHVLKKNNYGLYFNWVNFDPHLRRIKVIKKILENMLNYWTKINRNIINMIKNFEQKKNLTKKYYGEKKISKRKNLGKKNFKLN
jgi:hypothetical protein